MMYHATDIVVLLLQLVAWSSISTAAAASECISETDIILSSNTMINAYKSIKPVATRTIIDENTTHVEEDFQANYLAFDGGKYQEYTFICYGIAWMLETDGPPPVSGSTFQSLNFEATCKRGDATIYLTVYNLPRCYSSSCSLDDGGDAAELLQEFSLDTTAKRNEADSCTDGVFFEGTSPTCPRLSALLYDTTNIQMAYYSLDPHRTTNSDEVVNLDFLRGNAAGSMGMLCANESGGANVVLLIDAEASSCEEGETTKYTSENFPICIPMGCEGEVGDMKETTDQWFQKYTCSQDSSTCEEQATQLWNNTIIMEDRHDIPVQVNILSRFKDRSMRFPDKFWHSESNHFLQPTAAQAALDSMFGRCEGQFLGTMSYREATATCPDTGNSYRASRFPICVGDICTANGCVGDLCQTCDANGVCTDKDGYSDVVNEWFSEYACSSMIEACQADSGALSQHEMIKAEYAAMQLGVSSYLDGSGAVISYLDRVAFSRACAQLGGSVMNAGIMATTCNDLEYKSHNIFPVCVSPSCIDEHLFVVDTESIFSETMCSRSEELESEGCSSQTFKINYGNADLDDRYADNYVNPAALGWINFEVDEDDKSVTFMEASIATFTIRCTNAGGHYKLLEGNVECGAINYTSTNMPYCVGIQCSDAFAATVNTDSYATHIFPNCEDQCSAQSIGINGTEAIIAAYDTLEYTYVESTLPTSLTFSASGRSNLESACGEANGILADIEATILCLPGGTVKAFGFPVCIGQACDGTSSSFFTDDLVEQIVCPLVSEDNCSDDDFFEKAYCHLMNNRIVLYGIIAVLGAVLAVVVFMICRKEK